LTHIITPDINEERAHPHIDHQKVEVMFSAFQHKLKEDHSEIDTENVKQRENEISIIDGRRAHNCSIVLMNLKMNIRQIYHAILSLDEDQELSTNIIEQLLKYVPASEEVALLADLQDQVHLFAAADRFMYVLRLF
jgi:dishevelled associated activator of morphogenesis